MVSAGLRKHLRLVASTGDETESSAQEFAVRFSCGSGLLAWLRRPRNRFGWVGAGTLHFDERGLEITARRLTALGVRRTRRMLHAAEVRDASREGEAICITLRAGARQEVLRVWAVNAAAAAQIIALLPTSRTVEVDRDGRGNSYAARPWGAWLLATAAAAAVVLVWFAASRFMVAPQHTPPHAVALPLPRVPAAPADELRRVVMDAPEAEVLLAWTDLQSFLRASSALTTQFGTSFRALLEGGLSQEDFTSGLEKWLEPQWRVLEAQLPPAGRMSLRTLADDKLRAISVDWQRALRFYAHGLRTHDYTEVNRAFDCIRAAEHNAASAQALLDEVERGQHSPTATAGH